MLLAISIYGSWVMAGVAQEKTGRVAELLVAAIAPRHLLAGKVIGIGALGRPRWRSSHLSSPPRPRSG